MTLSRIEPATFWLVEQGLNQLRHRVPQIMVVTKLKSSAILLPFIHKHKEYRNPDGYILYHFISIQRGSLKPYIMLAMLQIIHI
jgi:hypothetical protein